MMELEMKVGALRVSKVVIPNVWKTRKPILQYVS